MRSTSSGRPTTSHLASRDLASGALKAEMLSQSVDAVQDLQVGQVEQLHPGVGLGSEGVGRVPVAAVRVADQRHLEP